MKDAMILGGFFTGLVATTAMVTTFSVIQGSDFPTPKEQIIKQSYGSLSAAYDVCDKKIIEKYGSDIRSKYFDDLSSRHDEKRGEFLVFADIIIGETLNSSKELRVICLVEARTKIMIGFKTITPDDDSPILFMKKG